MLEGSKFETLTPKIFSTPKKIVRGTKIKPAHLILWGGCELKGSKCETLTPKIFSAPKKIVREKHSNLLTFFFVGVVS